MNLKKTKEAFLIRKKPVKCGKMITRLRNIIFSVLLAFNSVESFCQADPFYFRVYLTDKGSSPLTFTPSDILSERAIARREKEGIFYPDFRDFPVSKQYIDSIKSLGFKFICDSKWMNTAVFSYPDSEGIQILQELDFVVQTRIVKTPVDGRKSEDKFSNLYSEFRIGSYDTPLRMINGTRLHDAGYQGNNILIAVLDAGFINADEIESLIHLINRGGIKDTYDFVEQDDHVYESSDHGTAVLSILSGKLPGILSGSAPESDYLLLKTEDVLSEFPCEEDFWAAGAEFADSAGADIITSSLGYSTFDDPSMDYSHTALDGNTAFISIVADVAASKGIAVFNSAGNERNNDWVRIIFPADGDSVIAVAAVDENRNIASFSSVGFSVAERTKPDVAAMGIAVPLQVIPSSVSAGNGTSFACPIISGMAACLLQAAPTATKVQISDAIKKSADRYLNPDNLYGYGIPDMFAALRILLNDNMIIPDDKIIVFPNPFSTGFNIIFSKPPGKVQLEIISGNGRLISKKEFDQSSERTIPVTELVYGDQGLYIIKVITNDAVFVRRVIKINN